MSRRRCHYKSPTSPFFSDESGHSRKNSHSRIRRIEHIIGGFARLFGNFLSIQVSILSVRRKQRNYKA